MSERASEANVFKACQQQKKLREREDKTIQFFSKFPKILNAIFLILYIDIVERKFVQCEFNTFQRVFLSEEALLLHGGTLSAVEPARSRRKFSPHTVDRMRVHRPQIQSKNLLCTL